MGGRIIDIISLNRLQTILAKMAGKVETLLSTSIVWLGKLIKWNYLNGSCSCIFRLWIGLGFGFRALGLGLVVATCGLLGDGASAGLGAPLGVGQSALTQHEGWKLKFGPGRQAKMATSNMEHRTHQQGVVCQDAGGRMEEGGRRMKVGGCIQVVITVLGVRVLWLCAWKIQYASGSFLFCVLGSFVLRFPCLEFCLSPEEALFRRLQGYAMDSEGCTRKKNITIPITVHI